MPPRKHAHRLGAEGTRMLEIVMPRLEVHYSALNLISRMALCVGFALFFCFVAGLMSRHDWFTTANYGLAVMMLGIALTCLYRLLTATGQVVISIDGTGFKDIRLTPTIMPWSEIQSVSPYIPYRSRKATGVTLAIDPAFKRSLSIRLGAKLFRWANLSFGSVFNLDLGTLDVEADEISRVAESHLSKNA
jgi:hypothetical protein